MNLLAKLRDRVITFFFLFLALAIIFLIPLRVLSYGWTPNYANILSASLVKYNFIPINNEVIKECVKTNSSVFLKEKEDYLFFLVTANFIILNIICFCFVKNHLVWFASMTVLMLFNGNFILKILNCSPQISLCLILMLIIEFIYEYLKKYPTFSAINILIFIYFLRFVFSPEIYFIDEFNFNYNYFWTLQLNEFGELLKDNSWLCVAPFIMLLNSYKQKKNFMKELDNPLLFGALFLQLFINFGYIDLALFRDTLLLIWFYQEFDEIVKRSSCFKEPRVKFCMGIYVLLTFFMLATHDGLGRYSKNCIENMPIDFSMKELQEWIPEEKGIIYNDNIDFAFSQYSFNSSVKNSYHIFSLNSLSEKEKENLLNIKRMLKKGITPLPDYYEDWVEKMKPSDRLITSAKINGLNNIEWLRCGKKRWIGRLKKSES